MRVSRTERRARDVMTVEPVCVPPSTSVRELARLFEDHEISGVPVVDQQGRVIGVVSKTDLIRRCTREPDDLPPTHLAEFLSGRRGEEADGDCLDDSISCVGDFMTEDPLTVRADAPVAELARLMFDRRIHRVIVTDKDNFPIGIVTSMDVLGCFAGPQSRGREAG